MDTLSTLRDYLPLISQLWEDVGNWRSALRKKARIFVSQRYQWDPENRREVNATIAKDLLGDRGAFLRNGVDEQVSSTVHAFIVFTSLHSGAYQQPSASCIIWLNHRLFLH